MDVAVEVSLQPWRAFKPDGVILFSDILTPLTGMNIPFDIVQGKGPIIHDPIRTEYIKDHLRVLMRAREHGFDVRGYFAWSLLDNLEWASGWTKKFGIVRVDPSTGTRTVKDSARWYRELISSRSTLEPPS